MANELSEGEDQPQPELPLIDDLGGSENIIAESKELTIADNPQTTAEQMETHAHHLHHAPGKKFWHYFYEFLMLFLAVFCGFLAENLREHFVENQKEVQYMRSVTEDLNSDIHMLDSIVKKRRNQDIMMDSVLYLMNYSDLKKNGNDIYYLTRWVPRTYRFITNDRTLSQLRNAGNWRLIRNSRVSERLSTYDNLVRTLAVYIEQREESLILILYPSINKIFDNKVFNEMVTGLNFTRPQNNPQLLTDDKMILNEFCNQVHFRKNANIYFITVAEKLLTEALQTLAVIKEEYHLK